MQRHTEQEISDKVSCFFCALRLPEVLFLHYLCKAKQKNSVPFGVLKKSLYYPAKRENEVGKKIFFSVEGDSG